MELVRDEGQRGGGTAGREAVVELCQRREHALHRFGTTHRWLESGHQYLMVNQFRDVCERFPWRCAWGTRTDRCGQFYRPRAASGPFESPLQRLLGWHRRQCVGLASVRHAGLGVAEAVPRPVQT